jgi:hypothetical protein
MSDNNKYDGMPFHQFPIHSEGLKVGLRDYFAGQALASMDTDGYTLIGMQSIVQRAYDIADAMIAEREKERA